MAALQSASATGLLNVEKELVCFICTEVLYQPLTLLDCLHSFCGSCLKEWFYHQRRKAQQSRPPPTNPYTCPTCRAVVKDTQNNAMVNTLLEMFLKANPERARSDEDRAEMSANYKAGENIIPKLESRGHRERGRRAEDEAIAQERRTLQEATQRSLRDVHSRTHGPPTGRMVISASGSARERSPQQQLDRHQQEQAHQSRQERRQRRTQREEREMRTRIEAVEATHSRQDQATSRARSIEGDRLVVPGSATEQIDGEEEQRHTVAHQNSLRSLVSVSESGTGTGDSLNEARIMQEILSEGLLDGINIDELTEAEQDELSERIAQAYRQRHRSRMEESQPPSVQCIDSPSVREPRMRDDASIVVQPERGSRHSSRNRHVRRTSSTERQVSALQPTNTTRPPPSRPHLLDQTNNLSPPTSSQRQRRHTSDHERRRSHSRSRLSTPPEEPRHTASRSATDLSTRSLPAEQASIDHTRQFSERRVHTEPQATPTELWMRGGVAHQSPSTISKSRPDTTIATSNSDHGSRPAAGNGRGGRSVTLPTRPHEAVADNNQLSRVATASMRELVVRCAQCSRDGIQYEVYKHCEPCKIDLCLKCYRSGHGCRHWFGFGFNAMVNFEAELQSSRRDMPIELPHRLISRQYRRPESINDDNHATMNLPAGTPRPLFLEADFRLQEGHFCDRCNSFANAFYWSCDTCNEGEWGFCNKCVNTHLCCSHPLLPMTHKSFTPASNQPAYDPHHGATALTLHDMHANLLRPSPVQSAASSATSMTDRSIGALPGYVNLTITTNCDICSQPIVPTAARFHCPFHSTPSPQQPDNKGDYDICISCYDNLVSQGRIKHEDSSDGWRRCPEGHRMIIIIFTNDREGGQRRTILNDLVGGWKMTEDDITAWNHAIAKSKHDPVSQLETKGKWTWREDEASDRRASRVRALTLDQARSDNKYPPDGGLGMKAVARWSYYPEEGEEGKGEIMFPKGAEIKEIENVNEEWFSGVYMGEVGVGPRVFLREPTRY